MPGDVEYPNDSNLEIRIHNCRPKRFEIFKYDNGPDYFSEGLIRIIKDGKIGYANELGKIVIDPQYDCAWPFANGKASVSNNCSIEMEGEHKIWISENWINIDKKGVITE